jgi:cell division septal protein FtsQ
LTLILCSLSALFVVQLTKVIVTPRLQDRSVRSALIKMTLSVLVAAGTAWLLDPHHPRELAVFAIAGAGLAMGEHKVLRLASLYGDWLITTIMRNRRP